MDIDKVVVLIAVISGIIFTYWFFLHKKDKAVFVDDEVDILVNGGYTPSTISIPQKKPFKISFTRTDPSSCLEEVMISDFKIKKYLPMNKKITLQIVPQKKGVFNFTCGMNMFHGKIIVT